MLSDTKEEEDGIIWDTDYVMNFNEHRMAIRLDRSYTEDALVTNDAFSTPYFIAMLIREGYVREDARPFFIKGSGLYH